MYCHVQEGVVAGKSESLQFDDDEEPSPSKWPKDRCRIKMDTEPSKTLLEAFSWPTTVKKTMEKVLKEDVPGDAKPVIAAGMTLKVASHFSGVCSQTRGAMVLQENGFGVSFQHVRNSIIPSARQNHFSKYTTMPCHKANVPILLHVTCFFAFLHALEVSFCEKTRQGRATLCRDFPNACVFTDEEHILDPLDRTKMSKLKSQTEVSAFLQNVSFSVRSQCAQHKYLCKLDKKADMALFGVPCVDDSTMGTMKMDDGACRNAPWLNGPFVMFVLLRHLL